MRKKCKILTIWGKNAGARTIAKLARKFDDKGKFKVNIKENTILQNNDAITKIAIAKGVFAVIDKIHISRLDNIYVVTDGCGFFIEINQE